MAGSYGQLGDHVVAGRQVRFGEDARYDLARRVVAAAHRATVQTLLRADDSIAADRLQKTHSKNICFFLFG